MEVVNSKKRENPHRNSRPRSLATTTPKNKRSKKQREPIIDAIILPDRFPLRLVKTSPDAILPSYAHDGDAGLDLYSPIDVVLLPRGQIYLDTKLPRDKAKINMGYAMEIDPHYVGSIQSRSSLAWLYDIVIPTGTVDPTYRGNVHVILRNESDINEHHIKRGDRIAQMVFTRFAIGDIEVVDKLSTTSRGTGGFGSTDAKLTTTEAIDGKLVDFIDSISKGWPCANTTCGKKYDDVKDAIACADSHSGAFPCSEKHKTIEEATSAIAEGKQVDLTCDRCLKKYGTNETCPCTPHPTIECFWKECKKPWPTLEEARACSKTHEDLAPYDDSTSSSEEEQQERCV